MCSNVGGPCAEKRRGQIKMCGRERIKPPIYLGHQNIWEISLKQWAAGPRVSLRSPIPPARLFSAANNGRATNHCGMRERCCVCVCSPLWYLTTQMGHSLEPGRTNWPAWKSLRVSPAQGEKNRPETQGTGP